MNERAVSIGCEGEQLIGIIHTTSERPIAGVIIVVGGPQYRIGSHRQFASLARGLSQSGIACLRFDQRGTGDSSGEPLGFQSLDADIRAAIDRLLLECRELTQVYLWGLCDAASAILMYAWQDARVAGIALANPWVRSAEGQAKVILGQYYLRRLQTREFWRKLATGDVGILHAARELVANWRAARRFGSPAPQDVRRPQSFQDRMLHGLEAFERPVLLITSGDDLTAAEFLALVAASSRWRRALERSSTERHHLAEANHTFSSARWRKQIEDWTALWLRSCAGAR
jgi:exosortase A-associated hydrolase 1